MKDFRQTKTTHLTLLPFIVRRYREFECRLVNRRSKKSQELDLSRGKSSFLG